MGKSQRLRLGDVRAVFRLIAECRELGADALAWRTHLANGVCRLTGALMGIVVELDGAGQGVGTIIHGVDVGWTSPEARSRWMRNQLEGQYRSDPIIRQVFQHLYSRSTYLREQIVPDRIWYNSTLFNDFSVPAGIDDCITSFHVAPGARRAVCSLAVHRPTGARRYTHRDRRLVQLCYDEIGRLEGTALATARDPSPSDLSPRLQQVLACLLEGDGEKQLAAWLGLSRDTVHEYVKRVYRHFRVNTRAELMAYFLRRSGLRPPGQTL